MTYNCLLAWSLSALALPISTVHRGKHDTHGWIYLIHLFCVDLFDVTFFILYFYNINFYKLSFLFQSNIVYKKILSLEKNL